ncbi:hypothetical protein EDB83DRAFT_2558658 [Lactarius deliciosus]|nr:hypothetical protein EDB83DRAFT_2558658 [Lactarius deliciosus]
MIDLLPHQQKYKWLFWALRSFWKWQKQQKLGRGFRFRQAWPKSSKEPLEGEPDLKSVTAAIPVDVLTTATYTTVPAITPVIVLTMAIALIAITFIVSIIPIFITVVIALSPLRGHVIVIFMVTLGSHWPNSGGSGSDVAVDLVNICGRPTPGSSEELGSTQSRSGRGEALADVAGWPVDAEVEVSEVEGRKRLTFGTRYSGGLWGRVMACMYSRGMFGQTITGRWHGARVWGEGTAQHSGLLKMSGSDDNWGGSTEGNRVWMLRIVAVMEYGVAAVGVDWVGWLSEWEK